MICLLILVTKIYFKIKVNTHFNIFGPIFFISHVFWNRNVKVLFNLRPNSYCCCSLLDIQPPDGVTVPLSDPGNTEKRCLVGNPTMIMIILLLYICLPKKNRHNTAGIILFESIFTTRTFIEVGCTMQNYQLFN